MHPDDLRGWERLGPWGRYIVRHAVLPAMTIEHLPLSIHALLLGAAVLARCFPTRGVRSARLNHSAKRKKDKKKDGEDRNRG